MAQGEREVALSQGDGPEIVRPPQELEGTRMQLNRRRRRPAASLSRSSRIETQRLALHIDLFHLQGRSRAPRLDASRDPPLDDGAELRRAGHGGPQEARSTCAQKHPE